MRSRIEMISKILCIALGALLLVQIVRGVIRSNPLSKVSIPAVPTLGTNAPDSKASNAAPKLLAQSATNSATNVIKAAVTNVSVVAASAGTNPAAANAPVPKPLIPTEVNVASAPTVGTNGTNVSVVLASVPDTGSNNVTPLKNVGTNSVAMSVTNASGTNSIARGPSSRPPGSGPRPNMAMAGMPGMPGMGGGKPLPELPPATKARIDRIYESELLGPVMRPMPAALMGIAGNVAFLRSSNGQTGSVKEGDSLGEMKLVKIGINRVLVEEAGQQKELMIFNGYGGESLLSKKETPDETTRK